MRKTIACSVDLSNINQPLGGQLLAEAVRIKKKEAPLRSSFHPLFEWGLFRLIYSPTLCFFGPHSTSSPSSISFQFLFLNVSHYSPLLPITWCALLESYIHRRCVFPSRQNSTEFFSFLIHIFNSFTIK